MGKVLGSASLPFTACVALFISGILLVLSFASPYWAHDGSRSMGLWRYAACLNPAEGRDCYKYEHVDFYVQVWLNAVRGLSIAAIVLVSIPLVVLPVYIYVSLGLYFKRTMCCMLIMSLLACGCMVAAVTVYALSVSADGFAIKWCVYTCVVAAICAFVAAFILLAAALGSRPKDLKQVYLPSSLQVHPDKPKVCIVHEYI